MIKIDDTFHNNEKYVNVYTDASMSKIPNPYGKDEPVGCAGAILTHNNKIIRTSQLILRNTTNNIAELTAVNLGLLLAANFPGHGIRLFSDSQVSIFTIRDRIFKYVQTQKNGVLMTDSNTELKNVTQIMEIINNILTYDIHVDLYHQKGHVNINNQKDIDNAKMVFAASNGIPANRIEDSYIRNISFYNNYIDHLTRQYLKDNLLMVDQLAIQPFKFEYRPFNVDRYKKLIYKEAI